MDVFDHHYPEPKQCVYWKNPECVKGTLTDHFEVKAT